MKRSQWSFDPTVRDKQPGTVHRFDRGSQPGTAMNHEQNRRKVTIRAGKTAHF